jgi:hypothetical protein
MILFGISPAKKLRTMTTKPVQSTSKTSPFRAVRKGKERAAETTRMFIDVDEMIRRPQSAILTRYVE